MMKKSGQIILVLISILFTAYQKIFDGRPFLTLDFFLFTSIAWGVGWQYDKARFFAKKARESEESYKLVLDSLPESVIIHRDYLIVYLNNAAVEMVGALSKQDIVGKSILDFLSSDSKNRSINRIKQLKRDRQPLNNIEHHCIGVQNTKFTFEASSLKIIFENKDAILTIGKDVTERNKKAEQLLQKSEKLSLLGQMAAGIAHEIRNPLTSIKGFVQLFEANSQQKQYIDIVLSELDRINMIVGEFLVLAKPTAAVFSKQNISVLINEVVTLFQTQSILTNVGIEGEYEKDLPMVSCEVNQLKQVFLNLLKNSLEAMPKGGTIYVKTKKLEGNRISIAIIDEGIGIPAERIPTLGEPFYTTKEKGTGLGLMTSMKIIENHQGQLKISSKVNEGTKMEIILPSISPSVFDKEIIHS